MKKILIIHNNYRDTGGEDIAVKNELEFLNFNFKTLFVEESNKSLNIFDICSIMLFNMNLRFLFKIRKNVSVFKPDFIYIHNTWFIITPFIIKYFSYKGIKVVIKLHNFRYFCSSSLLKDRHLVSNSFCRACGLNFSKRSVFNKYFENSYFKSMLLWRQNRVLVNSLKNDLNLTIFVLTTFHKNFITSFLGIEENKVVVVPNYMSQTEGITKNKKIRQITYAGRISNEKGVETLIRAFNSINKDGYILNIIGGGPELIRLQKLYADSTILFHGQLSNLQALKIISESNLVISCTNLYEGQPTLLCEAVFMKIPIIFPKSGGIEEFFTEDNELAYEFNINEVDSIEIIAKKLNLGITNNFKDLAQRNLDKLNKVLDKDKILNAFTEIASG